MSMSAIGLRVPTPAPAQRNEPGKAPSVAADTGARNEVKADIPRQVTQSQQEKPVDQVIRQDRNLDKSTNSAKADIAANAKGSNQTGESSRAGETVAPAAINSVDVGARDDGSATVDEVVFEAEALKGRDEDFPEVLRRRGAINFYTVVKGIFDVDPNAGAGVNSQV